MMVAIRVVQMQIVRPRTPAEAPRSTLLFGALPECWPCKIASAGSKREAVTASPPSSVPGRQRTRVRCPHT